MGGFAIFLYAILGFIALSWVLALFGVVTGRGRSRRRSFGGSSDSWAAGSVGDSGGSHHSGGHGCGGGGHSCGGGGCGGGGGGCGGGGS